jgi:hypothetical protein
MSARSGVHFSNPDFVVGLRAVGEICDELEKIAAANPPRPDATRLLDELKLHFIEANAGLDENGPTFALDDQQRAILRRATDHLINLKPNDDVIKIRDALRGPGQWTSYSVRKIRGGRPFDFTSYSGSYGMNDRLIDTDGSEYRVVGLGPGDPPELVVEAWRPE